jgi:hypothetical protein
MPGNKNAKKRDAKKRHKISRLMQVLPSGMHAMDKECLKSKPVFFSGTSTRTVPKPVPANSLILSAKEDLKVIDTVEGARMELESGDLVFILIPRCDSIQRMTKVKKTLRALYALDRGKKCAEVRGKRRIPVAEDYGRYTTVGLKPNRFQKGVCDSWPAGLSDANKEEIIKLMKGCHDAAMGYLRSNELRGLGVAKTLGAWTEIVGDTARGLFEIVGDAAKGIWASLACGLNYFLNSHTDEDFFYSLTTVVSVEGLMAEIDRYAMDAEVCNYFTFAEQGIAVALRPGDMLIFNPMYEHCLSSRTSAYGNKDVFCLSLYLKSAVVGKNDNGLPLTEKEIDALA